MNVSLTPLLPIVQPLLDVFATTAAAAITAAGVKLFQHFGKKVDEQKVAQFDDALRKSLDAAAAKVPALIQDHGWDHVDVQNTVVANAANLLLTNSPKVLKAVGISTDNVSIKLTDALAGAWPWAAKVLSESPATPSTPFAPILSEPLSSTLLAPAADPIVAAAQQLAQHPSIIGALTQAVTDTISKVAASIAPLAAKPEAITGAQIIKPATAAQDAGSGTSLVSGAVTGALAVLLVLGTSFGLSACGQQAAPGTAVTTSLGAVEHVASPAQIAFDATCHTFFGTAATPGTAHDAAMLMKAGQLKGAGATSVVMTAMALQTKCADPAALAQLSDAEATADKAQLDGAISTVNQAKGQ